MNKAEIIKGLNTVIEGLTALRTAIDSEDAMNAPTSAPTKTTAKATAKVAPKSTPVKAESETPSTDGQTYNRSDLVNMKYNDFKKLAASLGVDCKGTRDEIMSRVEALGVVTDDGGEAQTTEKKSAPTAKAAKAATKSDKPTTVGKVNAKKADDNGADEFDEQAEAIASETDTADIISALADVGVKASKLNYKKKLAEALREGKLQLDDEGEEDGGEDDTADASAEGEFSADSYFADYDLSEVNDPNGMTAERLAAVQEKVGAILEAVKNSELTSDDIVDYLQNNAEQADLDLLGDEYTEDDLLALYIEVAKHFIDNDGEEHEPGEPYEIGEQNFCCGQPLKYDKKTKKFMCEHCGTDYEAE